MFLPEQEFFYKTSPEDRILAEDSRKAKRDEKLRFHPSLISVVKLVVTFIVTRNFHPAIVCLKAVGLPRSKTIALRFAPNDDLRGSS